MNETPPPPSSVPEGETFSINTILVVIDGPVDNTRRPRRPSIPYTPPEDIPPSPKKPKKKPEDGLKDADSA